MIKNSVDWAKLGDLLFDCIDNLNYLKLLVIGEDWLNYLKNKTNSVISLAALGDYLINYHYTLNQINYLAKQEGGLFDYNSNKSALKYWAIAASYLIDY
jgi:hypothetical protein